MSQSFLDDLFQSFFSCSTWILFDLYEHYQKTAHRIWFWEQLFQVAHQACAIPQPIQNQTDQSAAFLPRGSEDHQVDTRTAPVNVVEVLDEASWHISPAKRTNMYDTERRRLFDRFKCSNVPTLTRVFVPKEFSPDFLIDLRLYSNSQPVVSYLALSQFYSPAATIPGCWDHRARCVLSFFGHHGRHGFGRGGGCHRDLSRASGVAQKWGDSPEPGWQFRNGENDEKPWLWPTSWGPPVIG